MFGENYQKNHLICPLVHQKESHSFSTTVSPSSYFSLLFELRYHCSLQLRKKEKRLWKISLLKQRQEVVGEPLLLERNYKGLFGPPDILGDFF